MWNSPPPAAGAAASSPAGAAPGAAAGAAQADITNANTMRRANHFMCFMHCLLELEQQNKINQI
jgi:hypothetical protein